MSKYKILAVAVVAALTSTSALAYTSNVTTAKTVASNNFDEATDAYTHPAAVNFTAAAGDTFIGRTSAYNVVITLSNGVFNSAITASELTKTSTTTGNLSVVSGGQPGDTSITIQIAGNSGVVAGEGVEINASKISVRNLNTTLNSTGGKLSVTAVVKDPTVGTEYATKTVTLAEAKEGYKATFTPGSNTQRIDVGTGKVYFVANGTIGSGAKTVAFDAGTIVAALSGLDVEAPALAGEKITVGLSGTNFSAFKDIVGTGTTNAPQYDGSIYLAPAGCDETNAKADADLRGTVNTAGDAVTFPDTLTGTKLATNLTVCLRGNGSDVIVPQKISASVTVKPANAAASAKLTGDLGEMKNNGTVVTVNNFNPASNTDQVSFLRISNLSSVDGKVSVDGTCDDGTKTPTTASMTLGKGKSVTLTSAALRDGTGMTAGMGACTGKLRLSVTGEFGSMEVQGFTKSRISSGEVTTNVNNDE